MNQGEAKFETRPLGKSGISLSALGFGGGPLGRAASDEAARAILDAAWQAGIRYFDTAPLYGTGESERRIGAALRARPRSDFVLSSKVGRLLRPTGSSGPGREIVFDYSRDGALSSFDASLARLGLERIDILLIHDIDRWTHGDAQPKAFAAALDGAYRAIADLKAAGRVRAIGLGVNEWQVCRDFAERAPVDCVLLAGRHTLLEREAGREFLPFCLERGIGVIIGGPFNSGVLATGAVPDARYNYAPAPPEILARVRRIETVVARHGVMLAAAALAFPLRHPAVATVIPGLSTSAEVADAAASVATKIPAELWDALRREDLID
jgi:D-threo-aldose 1-dehydrogenase